MRQLIIARKDLNMSAGKLSSQVSHASMAFLTAPLRDAKGDKNRIKRTENGEYVFELIMVGETYDDWGLRDFYKNGMRGKEQEPSVEGEEDGGRDGDGRWERLFPD